MTTVGLRMGTLISGTSPNKLGGGLGVGTGGLGVETGLTLLRGVGTGGLGVETGLTLLRGVGTGGLGVETGLTLLRGVGTGLVFSDFISSFRSNSLSFFKEALFSFINESDIILFIY